MSLLSDGGMDGWMDRWMDRWTEKQMDVEMHMIQKGKQNETEKECKWDIG